MKNTSNKYIISFITIILLMIVFGFKTNANINKNKFIISNGVINKNVINRVDMKNYKKLYKMMDNMIIRPNGLSEKEIKRHINSYLKDIEFILEPSILKIKTQNAKDKSSDKNYFIINIELRGEFDNYLLYSKEDIIKIRGEKDA